MGNAATALQLKHIHVGHTRVAILQTNLPAFTRWANKIISIQNPEKDICRAKICLQLLRAHNLITRRRHCTESTTESKINRSTFNSHHNLSLSLLQLQQMIYHLFLFQICISTITRKLQRFNYKSTRHGTHFMRVDYELLLIIHSVRLPLFFQSLSDEAENQIIIYKMQLAMQCCKCQWVISKTKRDSNT